MKNSADVVIIGGGIAGCTIAYYIAKKGVSNVILLEKNHLASGATGGCAGGLRTQLTSDVKIKLAQGSRKIYSELQKELRYERDLELDENGYLSLVYSEEGLEEMKETIIFQKERGVDVDYISPKDAQELFPTLSTEGILGAAFHSEGAIINPHLTTVAFAEAARRLGVLVYTNTSVTGIKTKAGKVIGVITSKGEIATPKVVNAAGLAFGVVSKMAGVDNVAVNVECMEGWATGPVEPIKSPSLTLSWTHPFFVFTQRKDGNLVLFGNVQNFNEVHASYRNDQSSQMISETAYYMLRAFPNLKDLQIIRHWMGPIPVSPDTHPILGEAEQIKGFYFAGLLCGHGFLMAPMVGKVMAETILGEEPTVSIKGLDIGRFERNESLESHSLL